MRRRDFLWTASAAAAGGVLLACTPGAEVGQAPATARPKRGGTLTFGLGAESRTLDIEAGGRQYTRLMFNALTHVDREGTITGELAESWSAPDPLTWEFKLKKGVKFHDGTDFDAAAVKFMVEWIKNPDNVAGYASELETVQSVSVVDSHTVRYVMTSPDVTFPARMSDRAGVISSPTNMQKWGKEFGVHPVGTGPFQFVEWVPNDHLTVKRWDQYFVKDRAGEQLPYLDSIVCKPILDTTVKLTALRTGQLDVIDSILPSDLAKVKEDSSLVLAPAPGSAQTLVLNNSVPPFDNKALRQAVAYAVNREALHKAIWFETGAVGTYQLYAGWAYNPQGTFYPYDLARARGKLAEGGQPNGFSFNVLATNTPIDLQVAQAIKAQLADVGIQMEISPITLGENANRRRAGTFEASTSFVPPVPDPDGVSIYIKTGSSFNSARYSNAAVDRLIEEARTVADQETRRQGYFQAQDLVLEDSPHIWIHSDSQVAVTSTKVVDFEPPVDTFPETFERTWLR